MPRFAANLSMLFTEHPFVERFGQAAEAGFEAVEFLFPYDEDIDVIKIALARYNQELVLFNLPAGNFAAGERGVANDPSRVREFRHGVERALDIADVLGCRRLNCLVGLAAPDVPLEKQWETAARNLYEAAELARRAGVRLQVEPLNTFDAPGYFIPTSAHALRLIEQVGHANLYLQYDVYHAQRMEGNLAATLRAQIERISHIQIADSPDRHEPGTGEINFPFVLDALDRAGYDGWVSLEYRPLGSTLDSLAWLRDWGYWR
jgi:hydroxypyruvate isomerase